MPPNSHTSDPLTVTAHGVTQEQLSDDLYSVVAQLTLPQTNEQLKVEFVLNKLAPPELYRWSVWFNRSNWLRSASVFSQSVRSGGYSCEPGKYPLGWRGKLLPDCLAACLQAVKGYCEVPSEAQDSQAVAICASLFEHRLWPRRHSHWRLNSAWDWRRPWEIFEEEIRVENIDFYTYVTAELPRHFAAHELAFDFC